MRSSLIMIAALALSASAAAQVGAPLVDGLGGPFGVGEPYNGADPLPLAPALPDGLLYYSVEPELFIRPNWAGSLSFDYGDYTLGEPIPGRLDVDGFGLRRIVLFGHSSELTQYNIGEIDPWPPSYYAQIPADGDGTPGRFVATWYQVTDRPPEPGTLRNTWQAIITGPDPADYAIEFRYHRCEWIHGHLREDQMAVMGFDSGEGPGGAGWMWPGSLSADAQLLCSLSNVREPGVFRYRIVDGLPTGCGVDAEPPPGEGRCADGNHLPGDGCSPACYVEPDVDGDGRFEAPHPDAVDPRGAYDDCFDVDNPLCNDDPDGDGVPSITDNCPDIPNPDQRSYDGDGFGDLCDADADNDILPVPANLDVPNRPEDLCPLLYSVGTRRIDPERLDFPQQEDIDGDGLGDVCDDDDDGDGVSDCGGDGLCSPVLDGYDNDHDGRVDEGTECANPAEDCRGGARDMFDNDADGIVDEFNERSMPFAVWPGPDAPPSAPEDNCFRIPNADQGDIDGDGVGDACDPDIDGDGLANCEGDGICGPFADGRDNDADGVIDEEAECAAGCDPDDDRVDQDRDGRVDEAFEQVQAALDGAVSPEPLDNCPRVANDDQADWDRDGTGDVCDDSDGDLILDAVDNCRSTANEGQGDLDGDGIGDLCDPDRDGDGVANGDEGCPDIPDDQVDSDGDGMGDACDPDDDDDGVNDIFDGCPRDYDVDQADLDGDGEGDVCDTDDDGDGADDADDVCPRRADDQTDTDGDGLGDACDDDDDGDGIADGVDLCPLSADAEQPDLDGDGIGDACDAIDDRSFDERTAEERCAILIADRAPTAERVRHCPPPVADSCATAPGRSPTGVWWLLLGVWLCRRWVFDPAR